MSIADIKKNADAKMAKSIEAFKNELQKIRTGRAHPAMFNKINAEYYGAPTPVNQRGGSDRPNTPTRTTRQTIVWFTTSRWNPNVATPSCSHSTSPSRHNREGMPRPPM